MASDLMEQVTPTQYGFHVKTVNGYEVHVWKQLFNWRLVIVPEGDTMTVSHGYCYFGLDADSLTRALLAGLAWEGPVDAEPIGYDKKAF